jgi:hypothetical protein
MPTQKRSGDLAEQLLDAQVRYVIAELTGDRLTEVIARDVDDVIGIFGPVPVKELLEPGTVKAIGRRLVVELGGSRVIEDMVGALADGIYDMGAADEYVLGEVLDRDAVAALVRQAVTMRRLSDRLLERLTESPLVATIAAKFVTRIVSDFMQQNRARAEKLPGMSTMLNIGAGAASKVRGVTDRHLDQILGDAAGRGAAFALKRTNNAIREMLRDAPLEQAALEVWDLHADEPIGDLRAYLSREELRLLAERTHEVVVSARETAYAGALVDACVDVFFDEYGEVSLSALLDDLGVTPANIVEDLQALIPRLVAVAQRDGQLEAQVRKRLEPFFRSDEVRALLGSTPRPAGQP